MAPRVKVCGITRIEDALACARLGVDAVGLVFAASPRRVEPEAARNIVESLPPFVCAVGVFVDAAVEDVLDTVRIAGLHAVQLSGNEDPQYVRELKASGVSSIIKAIRVATVADIDAAGHYDGVSILLDTASSTAAGGTGKTFPWRYAVDIAARRPVVLAGGLKGANVAEAVRTVRPWAVDVSSGVEKAPGIKDEAKIREFLMNARSI